MRTLTTARPPVQISTAIVSIDERSETAEMTELRGSRMWTAPDCRARSWRNTSGSVTVKTSSYVLTTLTGPDRQFWPVALCKPFCGNVNNRCFGLDYYFHFSYLMYCCCGSIINNKNKRTRKKSRNSLSTLLTINKIKVTLRKIEMFLFLIDENLHVMI